MHNYVHIQIGVPDLDAAADFYSKVFKWKVTKHPAMNNVAMYVPDPDGDQVGGAFRLTDESLPLVKQWGSVETISLGYFNLTNIALAKGNYIQALSYIQDFIAICPDSNRSHLQLALSYEAYVYPANDIWHVYLHGRLHTVRVEDERERLFRESTGEGVGARAEFQFKAPMPGLVIDVQVEEGQDVNAGDVLVVLESMKMQNELKSPQAGKIARLLVSPGDSVDQNETMLSVE